MKNKKISGKTSAKTLAKTLRYAKHRRLQIALAALFAVISTAATLYIPILIGKAIDCILESGVDFSSLSSYFLQIAVLTGAAALCQWLMNVSINSAAYGIVENIRKDAMHKIQRLPISHIDTHPHGDIVSRVTADVE
ncbi:MAG: ABC transporter ATP-binding protein, partial [Clostridia bacterium]|nr:ABC transporter ATP-binding protein [Clostridia bacterium]